MRGDILGMQEAETQLESQTDGHVGPTFIHFPLASITVKMWMVYAVKSGDGTHPIINGTWEMRHVARDAHSSCLWSLAFVNEFLYGLSGPPSRSEDPHDPLPLFHGFSDDSKSHASFSRHLNPASISFSRSDLMTS
ncbi:hypothetical protein A0H81_12635 [Grifola frondosa]|uniref:Uncharacterized protein n=1 Tax=Grifola frondosa TaxID=5627 RepID=A0A1C7LRP9_GRIFR|nr:hypothetical protein A0H81_12635 [Grifola frondosa]